MDDFQTLYQFYIWFTAGLLVVGLPLATAFTYDVVGPEDEDPADRARRARKVFWWGIPIATSWPVVLVVLLVGGIGALLGLAFGLDKATREKRKADRHARLGYTPSPSRLSLAWNVLRGK